MAVVERVELELGLEGGGILRCSVPASEADELVGVFSGDTGGLRSLETERGRVVVDLRRVAYVRELSRRRPLGFGG
jgi:hypothetical protein